MPAHPLTVDVLWRLPRVSEPVPDPHGRFAIVPVTEYDMEANKGTTRLWRVPTDGGEPHALTAPEVSSEHPVVSPGGRRLAFLRKVEKGGDPKPGEPRHLDQNQLYVMSLEGGEPERLTDLPLGVAQPRWFPDGRRIAFLVPLLKEAPDVEGTRALLAQREKEPGRPFATEDRFYRYWDRWLTDAPVPHIFALDIASRRLVDLTPGLTRLFDPQSDSGDYDIAPDGREIAFSVMRSDPPHDPLMWGVYTVTVPEATDGAPESPIELVAPEETGNAFGPRYSPDGRLLVYGMQRDVRFYADKVRLVARDRATHASRHLTEDWDRSASYWAFSEDASLLCIAAEEAGRRMIFALDTAAEPGAPGGDAALAAATAAPALPSEPRLVTPLEGWYGGIEIAAGRVFTTWQSLCQPPEVYFMRLDGSARRRLTRFSEPLLATLGLGEVEEMTFRGHGGDPVQAFLVHPPALAASPAGNEPAAAEPVKPTAAGAGATAPPDSAHAPPLALVHLVHGGPHGVFGDLWHWRWNAQVIAGAGYLVAMVNFHGSTGWGQAFTASILGRWGDQPYDDLCAATDALVERGLADPARMAVTGGSYGGYLVAWTVSQTDRFACAINHAGVSDFQTQYASDVTQGRRRAMGGSPWDDLDGLDRFNPLRHARGFKTPMLVMHGQRDFRVPHAQGIAIYNVYKAMRLPARLVFFPDENHWVQKPQNSRIWYGEFLAWLARWLGPAGQDTSQRR